MQKLTFCRFFISNDKTFVAQRNLPERGLGLVLVHLAFALYGDEVYGLSSKCWSRRIFFIASELCIFSLYFVALRTTSSRFILPCDFYQFMTASSKSSYRGPAMSISMGLSNETNYFFLKVKLSSSILL